jgi:hypothetical protein
MSRTAETIKRARLAAFEEAREALLAYHMARGYGATQIMLDCDGVLRGLVAREEGR